MWTVALAPEGACDRNNPAPTLSMDLVVFGETYATKLTLTGTWELGPVSNPSQPLEGEIDLQTGRFTAELWREPVAGNPLPEARGWLAGTIIDYGTLNAELQDPVSQASGILGAGACQYAATGQR